jgi:hypothetical protein
MHSPGNTYRSGRLSTVDLLNKVACLSTKTNKTFKINLILTSFYKEVIRTEPSTSARVPCLAGLFGFSPDRCSS